MVRAGYESGKLDVKQALTNLANANPDPL